MAATAIPTPPWVVSRGVEDGGLLHGVPVPAPQGRFFAVDEGWVAPAGKQLSADEGGGAHRGQRNALMPERKQNRGLVLVLDLDNTLLHSIPAVHLAPRESYLLRRPPPPQGRAQMFFNMAETHGYLIKLRPFARTFLREVAALYDLRICTMGTRTYALHMTHLLDPDGTQFSPGDIIAREDLGNSNKKGLDVVPGCDERATVILDDTVEVWDKNLDNLVPVRRYEYFAGCYRRGKSFAELKLDEEAAVGALAKALEMFSDSGAGGYVREVLLRLRKKPELRGLQRGQISNQSGYMSIRYS